MNFGVEFSELFLDSSEKAGDIQSKINLHNNHVGRMVSLQSSEMEVHANNSLKMIKFRVLFRPLRTTCKFGASVTVCQGLVS